MCSMSPVTPVQFPSRSTCERAAGVLAAGGRAVTAARGTLSFPSARRKGTPRPTLGETGNPPRPHLELGAGHDKREVAREVLAEVKVEHFEAAAKHGAEVRQVHAHVRLGQEELAYVPFLVTHSALVAP